MRVAGPGFVVSGKNSTIPNPGVLFETRVGLTVVGGAARESALPERSEVRLYRPDQVRRERSQVTEFLAWQPTTVETAPPTWPLRGRDQTHSDVFETRVLLAV